MLIAQVVFPLKREPHTAHTHTYISHQLASYSQNLTLILTLYDPGIPDHALLTLLTLHDTKNFATRRRPGLIGVWPVCKVK